MPLLLKCHGKAIAEKKIKLLKEHKIPEHWKSNKHKLNIRVFYTGLTGIRVKDATVSFGLDLIVGGRIRHS